MAWKCPPLHLPNWNNLWKWKEDMRKKTMNLEDLIEALDQRYGNPYAKKECGLIQQATEQLRKYNELLKQKEKNEDCNGK